MKKLTTLKAILAKYSNQIQEAKNVCEDAVKCHAMADYLIGRCQQGFFMKYPWAEEMASHYAEQLVECLETQDYTKAAKIYMVLEGAMGIRMTTETGEETHVYRAAMVNTQDGTRRCMFLYVPYGYCDESLHEAEALGIPGCIEVSEAELDPTSDMPVTGADYEVSFVKLQEIGGTVHLLVRKPYILKVSCNVLNQNYGKN